MSFVGIARREDFRIVARSHVIAWRKTLEDRELSGANVRRKLSALSSLFEYLCEQNAVVHNPVKGVKRPKVDSYEGKTPALGNHQARRLLDAPPTDTLKGLRHRAILSTLLYHGLRREELCALKVRDIHELRSANTCGCTARAARCATSPCIPARWTASTNTWVLQDTQKSTHARCFGR